MRCVDADAIMSGFCNDCQSREHCKEWDRKCSGYEDFKRILDKAPTIDTQIVKKADWQIGDEIRDEELNSNAIIVGVYEHQYECITFNGSDFDAFNIPCDGTIVGYKRTGKHFEQISEMIKIMGGNAE